MTRAIRLHPPRSANHCQMHFHSNSRNSRKRNSCTPACVSASYWKTRFICSFQKKAPDGRGNTIGRANGETPNSTNSQTDERRNLAQFAVAQCW